MHLTDQPRWTETAPWGTDSPNRRHTTVYYRHPNLTETDIEPGQPILLSAYIDAFPGPALYLWHLQVLAIDDHGHETAVPGHHGIEGHNATLHGAKAAATRAARAAAAAISPSTRV